MRLFDALIYLHAASESTALAAWLLLHCHDIVARWYLCRPFSQRHILISALFLSHIWFAYEWYTDFLQSFLHHFSFVFYFQIDYSSRCLLSWTIVTWVCWLWENGLKHREDYVSTASVYQQPASQNCSLDVREQCWIFNWIPKINGCLELI